MKLLPVILVVLLSACGGGGSTSDPISTKPNLVVYYGDSLVQQSGDRLQSRLPGYIVENHGLPGQMASQAISGTYGSLDVSRNAIYVIAWGMNEALQGVSDVQYRADINHILHSLVGKYAVIESPMLATNPQNNAPETVVRFRVILRELGAAYNVPVVDSVLRQDTWDGGGIHPSPSHYDDRATALAETIKLMR